VDIGVWEGLTRDEVFDRHHTEITALGRGEPVKLGGGESWDEFAERIDAALDDLIHSVGSGDRVLAVVHGGVIQTIVSGHLGFRSRHRPWPIEPLRNTALTTLQIDERGRRLLTYNDAVHLREVASPGNGTLVALIRHGETVANVEGRWAGSTDAPLTDAGRRQARALPERYDGARHVYSSPLVRARDTANAYASVHGLPVVVREDLVELDFGAWENLTGDEIAQRHPEEWQAVYVEGIDRPRGGTGETAEAAAARMARAIGDIASEHRGERVAVVSHGGAIRAFIGSLVGIGHADRHRFALPGNTSVSHVRAGEEVVLVDYNLGAV
jgi:broad specificity phosphatase PhoE